MKKISLYLFLAGALVLASCGSNKNIEKQKDTTQQPTAVSNVTAKLNLGIATASNDIDVDGKLQMRRDKMIRILITPFGLMEAGRLEITPDGILLVDRINNQYVKAGYNDIPEFSRYGVTFDNIQQKFFEEYKKESITISIDKVTLNINLNKISFDSNWDDTPYNVPDKYRKVSIQEAISKLTNL